MLQSVVAAAERTEIIRGSWPALGRINGMVEVAAVDRNPAPWKAAPLVSGTKPAPDLLARSISINRDDVASSGVSLYSFEDGVMSGKLADARNSDRTVPCAFAQGFRWLIRCACSIVEVGVGMVDEINRRDELDAGVNGFGGTPASEPEWIGGEQKVGEGVRAKLVTSPLIVSTAC